MKFFNDGPPFLSKFDKPGTYTIACKVQDNLAGEAIFSKTIEVS